MIGRKSSPPQRSAVRPILDIFNSLIREGFEKFGRYYSSYRGFVADNEDPDSFARLKLVVPQITGKEVMDYWAWPKGNFSGNGYGSQVIPNKGDMVWVDFEMGNPRKPIWDFGHFSFLPDGKTNEKPTNLRDVKNYWFKTPEGNLIEFDDSNGWVLLTPIDKFLVGSKNASEPAILGNQLKTQLESLCDLVSDIATAGAAVSNAGGPTANAADFVQLAIQVETFKATLSSILSQMVFLKE